jgi:hypothetical protein
VVRQRRRHPRRDHRPESRQGQHLPHPQRRHGRRLRTAPEVPLQRRQQLRRPVPLQARHRRQTPNQWVVHGYQGEIRNEIDLPNVSGFIYDEGGKRGRLCLVGEKCVWENGKKTVTGQTCTPEEFKEAFKLDDWNEYRIVASGPNIKQFINGVQTVDFTDKEPDQALKEGIFALQLHAGKPMWAEFKDVRLKKLEGAVHAGVPKAFFTTDDGKSFFVDRFDRVPPFRKDGKTAVRAQVFSCDDGRTKFVGYLEMYAPLDKAALEDVLAKGRGVVPHQGGIPMVSGPATRSG